MAEVEVVTMDTRMGLVLVGMGVGTSTEGPWMDLATAVVVTVEHHLTILYSRVVMG